jgi:hypothetical protein
MEMEDRLHRAGVAWRDAIGQPSDAVARRLLENAQSQAALQRPERSNRRLIAAIAAVAATVAIAVTTSLIVHARNQQTSAPPTRAPVPANQRPVVLRSAFTIDPVPGYDFSEVQVQRTVQSVQVVDTVHPSASPTGTVYLYASGVFNPAEAMHGQRLTIRGHRAYFAAISTPPPGVMNTPPNTPKALVWEYKPNAWAIVRFNPPDYPHPPSEAAMRSQETRIANAIHPEQAAVLRVPFRFGYIPPGLVSEWASGDVPPRATGSFGGWIGLSDGTPDATGTGFEALRVWVNDTSDPWLVFCTQSRGAIRTTPRRFVGSNSGDTPAASTLISTHIGQETCSSTSSADTSKYSSTISIKGCTPTRSSKASQKPSRSRPTPATRQPGSTLPPPYHTNSSACVAVPCPSRARSRGQQRSQSDQTDARRLVPR